MTRTLLSVLMSLVVLAPAFAGTSRTDAVIVGGTGADPSGVWRDISIMVDTAAATHHIPATQRDAFKSRILVSYTDARMETKGQMDARLSGRISLPTCQKNLSYAFQLESRQVAGQWFTMGGIQDVMEDPVEDALVEFAILCEAH